MANPILAPNSSWYKGTTKRSTLTKISIVDTYTATGNETESWNADVDNSGSIKCYINGTELTIAGNGSGNIAMNPDSSRLFNDANKSNDESNYFINVTTIDGLDLLDSSAATDISFLFASCMSLEVVDLHSWSVSNVTSMRGMFCNTITTSNGNTTMSIASIDGIKNWDTSSCKDMAGMFFHCTSLTKLDIEDWDVSNVESFRSMFCGNDYVGDMKLKELDVSRWDTSSCTNMACMFYGCAQLEYIPIENFNMSNVIDVNHMFADCFNLKSIDMSKWDTSKCEQWYAMFNDCISLTTIDVSNLDMQSAKYISQMFERCSGLTEIIGIENWDVSSIDGSYGLYETFYGCSSLKSLNLSTFKPKNNWNYYYAFADCSSLEELDLSTFDTSNSTTLTNMFSGMTSLKRIILNKNFSFTGNGTTFCSLPTPSSSARAISTDGNWYNARGEAFASADVPSNTAAIYYANKIPILAPSDTWYKGSVARANITKINIVDSYTPTGNETESWNADVDNSGSIKCYINGTELTIAGDGSKYIAMNTDSSFAFSSSGTDYFSNVTDISGADILDASGVTDMQRLFKMDSTLTSVDVSKWYTANTTNMQATFDRCSSLLSAEVDNWDTSSVTNMKGLFQGCTNIEELDLSKLDVSKVTTMNSMFMSNNTLGFMNLRSIGDVSNWDTSSCTDMSSMFRWCDKMEELNSTNWDVSKVTTMQSMFESSAALTKVDTSNWNLSSITDMSYMFDRCVTLRTLGDNGNLKVSRVENLSCTFQACSSLTRLDVSDWDISNCENISYMFASCSSITELDVSNWDVSKITNMTATFQGCNLLARLDVSNWNVSSCKSINHTFSNCTSLEELDVSNWDVSKITNMNYAFYGLIITKLDLSKWVTNSNCTDMSFMLSQCVNIAELDLSGFDTRNVPTINGMFEGMNNLRKIKLGANFYFNGNGTTTTPAVLPTPSADYINNADGNWYTIDGTVYTPTDVPSGTAAIYYAARIPMLAPNSTWYKGTIANKNTITEINIVDSYTVTGNETETWNADVDNSGSIKCYVDGTVLTIVADGIGLIAMNADSSYLFSGTTADTRFSEVTAINGAELLEAFGATNFNRLFYMCGKLTSVDTSNWDTSNVQNMNGVFNQVTVLPEAHVENWDMSACTDMSYMFQLAQNLTNLDLSSWDVSKVTTMRCMFAGNSSVGDMSLTSIGNVGNWNTSSVTDMSGMFQRCSALAKLDVSNWDVSNVTTMQSMFSACYSLENIDVSNWDVSNVTTMQRMFNGCRSITELDVSNWNVSKVTTMGTMFQCGDENGNIAGNLTRLDVSNWDTSSCTDMGWIFWGQPRLTSLDVSNWDVSKVESFHHAFAHCTHLVVTGLENWDVRSAKTLGCIFNSNKTTVYDLSGWDVSNCENFGQMFEHCTDAIEIKGLENWNTSNGKGFFEMFSGCISISTLDLSSFDTRNATESIVDPYNQDKMGMYRMFGPDYDNTEMYNLKQIKLGENFSFNGDGTCEPAVLPTPSAEYISGADGNWYTIDGTAYAAVDISSGIAATYYAVSPINDNEDRLIKRSTLVKIANALRSATGEGKLYTPDEMAEVISEMSDFTEKVISDQLTEYTSKTATVLRQFAFCGCSNLGKIDLWKVDTIRGSAFGYCSNLKTIIIRTNNVCQLQTLSTLSETPFASGGTGGTVYVHANLIESYKVATNWSVYYGYGTCNFVAIEGSEYE